MKFIHKKSERGMSLLELMFAGFVMVVGMLGSLILIATAIASNTRNRIDTTGTAVSQLVIEQMNALSSRETTTITITDCNGSSNSVLTTGTTSGSGATLLANNNAAWNLAGTVDFTQAYTSVPTGYKMQYVTCGGTTYDVRWNVTQLGSYTKMITVSARQLGITGQQSNNIRLFAPPVTLRTINGP
jgi:Tfp pilus assembly protein PilV